MNTRVIHDILLFSFIVKSYKLYKLTTSLIPLNYSKGYFTECLLTILVLIIYLISGITQVVNYFSIKKDGPLRF